SVSADGLVALDDSAQRLVAGPLPPVVPRENLDLLRAVIAGGLDHGANGFEVDDAVAHHAAVEEEVGGGHQPVADVVGEDAAHVSGAGDGGGEIGVPPDVIDVDGD